MVGEAGGEDRFQRPWPPERADASRVTVYVAQANREIVERAVQEAKRRGIALSSLIVEALEAHEAAGWGGPR